MEKSIAESSVKLGAAPVTSDLMDSSWPPLPTENSTSSQPVHLASLLHSHGIPQANPKVLHHISLVFQQLLIEYGPLEVN
jgi:hypothetical protein